MNAINTVSIVPRLLTRPPCSDYVALPHASLHCRYSPLSKSRCVCVTYYLVWLCGDSPSIASAVTNLARLHIRARCDSVLRSIVVSLNLVIHPSPKTSMLACCYKFLDTILLPKSHHANARVYQETHFDSTASRNAQDCYAFDRLTHAGLVPAVGHVRHC